jgi:hypothetical protein
MVNTYSTPGIAIAVYWLHFWLIPGPPRSSDGDLIG